MRVEENKRMGGSRSEEGPVKYHRRATELPGHWTAFVWKLLKGLGVLQLSIIDRCVSVEQIRLCQLQKYSAALA